MTDRERDFETKRVKDLLSTNSAVNMNTKLDLPDFLALMDKLVI